MLTFKSLILYILFFIIVPCKITIAQDTSVDSTVQNELENKYDSVLAKAAFSLTGGQYQQATDYYKEAQTLKPKEAYPSKMIKYVESIISDLAVKQKRTNDLKRKAAVRDNLIKADKAIADKSWDNARIFFSEILTLQPENTDEQYAKSKIEAIDIELKRIALRTPPKSEPVIPVAPKNRQQARALRKLAERNAKLASSKVNSASYKQTEVPVKEQTKVAVVPVTKQLAEKAASPLPNKKTASTDTITTAAQKVTDNRPTASLPTKDTGTISLSVNEAPQKIIEKTIPVQNTDTVNAAVKDVTQKLGDTLSTLKAAAVTNSQKSIETIQQKKTDSLAVLSKEVPKKPAKDLTPTANSTNTTVSKSGIEKISDGVETVTSDKKITPAANSLKKEREQMNKPKETLTSVSSAASNKPAEETGLKMADSTNNIKLTCENISFIGSNAYIKVLVQNNNSTGSFLTDTLQVSIEKNDGTVRKLEQRFISGFPVVLPQKELILVSFADASVGVDPDDIFILEMNDKPKKTKLALRIPWSVYKQ